MAHRITVVERTVPSWHGIVEGDEMTIKSDNIRELEKIKGKTISGIELDEGLCDTFVITFSDGTRLEICPIEGDDLELDFIDDDIKS